MQATNLCQRMPRGCDLDKGPDRFGQNMAKTAQKQQHGGASLHTPSPQLMGRQKNWGWGRV